MLKPVCAALIALALICSGRADAQSAADADTIAAAKELVTAMRLTDRFTPLMTTMVQAMKPAVLAGRPEMETKLDAVMAVLIEGMNARIDEFVGQMAGIYARNFNASELREGVLSHPGRTEVPREAARDGAETMTMGQDFGRNSCYRFAGTNDRGTAQARPGALDPKKRCINPAFRS
jgi:hypothetical protein